jgi:hypothetical protein
MRMPDVKTEYFALGGGLDLATPPLTMRPGILLEAVNWDIPATGGYRRVPGYERYNGRPAPSSASAQLLGATGTFAGTLAVGDTVNGQTSSATGKVVYISAGRQFIAVTRVTGAFTLGENIREVTTVVGVYAAVSEASTGAITNAIAEAAADDLRTDITAVPGSGPVRGVWVFNGERYAWRDNAGGTAGIMHKATSGGWAAVTLAEEISFTAGNDSVGVGDTLTQGGVTATVRKVVIRSGTTPALVGKLVISGRAGGNFAAGAATSTGGGVLTLSGAQTAQAFPVGGKYSFINHNFGGDTATTALYGANGVSRGFEFDGTYLCFIDTGMTLDTPSYVQKFKSHLFFSFKHSVQHSAPGDPFVWSVILGAGEIAVGADVTILLEGADALIVQTKNSTHGLFGTGVGDWSFQPIVPDVGARLYTSQMIGRPVFLDDLGITRLDASQVQGNFEGNQLSAKIKKWLDDRIETATCSVVVRKQSQYRLFFSSGDGVTLTFVDGKLAGCMPFNLPIVANVACEGETGSGSIVLVGCNDGYVYEMEKGRSFDGSDISHRIRLAWSFARSPRVRKTFKRALLDIAAAGFARLTMGYIAQRNDASIDSATATQTPSFTGGGAGWDDPSTGWDEMAWDADAFTRAGGRLNVTATDVSLYFSGTDADQLSYTINGIALEYIMRRQDRKHS